VTDRPLSSTTSTRIFSRICAKGDEDALRLRVLVLLAVFGLSVAGDDAVSSSPPAPMATLGGSYLSTRTS